MNHIFFSPVGTDAFTFNEAGIPASGVLTGQDCCKTQDEVDLFGGYTGNYEGNVPEHRRRLRRQPVPLVRQPRQQQPGGHDLHVARVRQDGDTHGRRPVRLACGYDPGSGPPADDGRRGRPLTVARRPGAIPALSPPRDYARPRGQAAIPLRRLARRSRPARAAVRRPRGTGRDRRRRPGRRVAAQRPEPHAPARHRRAQRSRRAAPQGARAGPRTAPQRPPRRHAGQGPRVARPGSRGRAARVVPRPVRRGADGRGRARHAARRHLASGAATRRVPVALGRGPAGVPADPGHAARRGARRAVRRHARGAAERLAAGARAGARDDERAERDARRRRARRAHPGTVRRVHAAVRRLLPRVSRRISTSSSTPSPAAPRPRSACSTASPRTSATSSRG